jgi:hypothetical protein
VNGVGNLASIRRSRSQGSRWWSPSSATGTT